MRPGSTRSRCAPPGSQATRDPAAARSSATRRRTDRRAARQRRGARAGQAAGATPELRERRIRARRRSRSPPGSPPYTTWASRRRPRRLRQARGGAPATAARPCLPDRARDLARLADAPKPATGRFEMRGVKFYADGALGRAARATSPTATIPRTSGCGAPAPGAADDVVEAAVAGGWQVGSTRSADAAVGAVIDAFLAANHAAPGRTTACASSTPGDRREGRAADGRGPRDRRRCRFRPRDHDMPWPRRRLGAQRVLARTPGRTMLEHHIPVAAGRTFRSSRSLRSSKSTRVTRQTPRARRPEVGILRRR